VTQPNGAHDCPFFHITAYEQTITKSSSSTQHHNNWSTQNFHHQTTY